MRPSKTLGSSLSRLKDAQAAFLEGRYADAVAECRTALDSAIPDKEFCPWNEKKSETRNAMTVEARFRLSWCSLPHFTHPAHHSNGMNAEFTRPMAQYVLGATCLALSLWSRQRDMLVKPERSSPAG